MKSLNFTYNYHHFVREVIACGHHDKCKYKLSIDTYRKYEICDLEIYQENRKAVVKF